MSSVEERNFYSGFEQDAVWVLPVKEIRPCPKSSFPFSFPQQFLSVTVVGYQEYSGVFPLHVLAPLEKV
jgi:hypothetical protein